MFSKALTKLHNDKKMQYDSGLYKDMTDCLQSMNSCVHRNIGVVFYVHSPLL